MRPETHTPRLFGDNIKAAVEKAISIRKQLRSIRVIDITQIEEMQNLNEEARQQLYDVELIADAMIGAALESGGNENTLNAALGELAGLAGDYLDGNPDIGKTIRQYAKKALSVDLSAGKPARKPLHWVLSFPEVFEAGGFDGIVGNPPFMGGQKISGAFGKAYLEFLKYAYAPAGAIDMVGFFFRRNFALLKDNGAFGDLATNTIAQGGTREGSLEVIENENGSIMMAVKSMPWPGTAAVSVSIAAIFNGKWKGPRKLDEKYVDHISTYFDIQVTINNPYLLVQNLNKSFIGSYVLGMGFVLTPEKAKKMISENPINKDVIFPYLNGEDLNGRIDQSPSRWVINFRDWPLNKETADEDYDGPVAEDYPDCLEIV
jgi:hypothetical protein